MSRREEIIAATERVITLRVQLRDAEATLDRLLSDGSQSGMSSGAAVGSIGTAPAVGMGPRGDSLMARVVHHALLDSGRIYVFSDFVSLQGESSDQTLRAAILRAVSLGWLDSAGRGKYRVGKKSMEGNA